MSERLTTFRWQQLTAAEQSAVLERPAVKANAEISAQAAAIIDRVKQGGDKALIDLAAELDDVSLTDLKVSDTEAAEAAGVIGPEACKAINIAIANVRAYHEAQQTAPITVETTPGVVCERIIRAIPAVGLYVPAGTAPLPSTAIMLSVPAAIADCNTRVMCTPARPDGKADPAVVYAAWQCGVRNIYKVGGAQAVAAMAYGTESIAKVDKVFGPGNAWFTAAKTIVSADPAGAALDMPAGPSEVMVVADDNAAVRAVALDLLSQAEHGPDSQVILVTTSEQLSKAVDAAIGVALETLPRRAIIEQALSYSVSILVDSISEAIDVANTYAPEHLIIQVDAPRDYLERVQNAGSVFLGPWTPESVGDYCSGTNHVLPTYGYARSYSGLSLAAFQKQVSVQELTYAGLKTLEPTVTTLAGLEGLDAHAQAVLVRIEDEEGKQSS
ncbi:histidinol dehydrogenase [Gammaproteobacteria bacterium]|nr:histidinol dehydrogenase [Gammaproteobacteria bacterium]